MKRTLLLLASGAAAALCAVTGDAHALGPVSLEVGGRLGYGTSPSNSPGGPINPLGLGLGARVGVDLSAFYGGVNVTYYFGGSQDGFSEHSLMEGIDLGYNIKLPMLTIRPLVGFGHYALSGSGSASSGGVTVTASSTTNSIYVEPGVVVLLTLGIAYVGADVGALLLTGMPQSNGTTGLDVALTVDGQVGVKF